MSIRASSGGCNIGMLLCSYLHIPSIMVRRMVHLEPAHSGAVARQEELEHGIAALGRAPGVH